MVVCFFVAMGTEMAPCLKHKGCIHTGRPCLLPVSMQHPGSPTSWGRESLQGLFCCDFIASSPGPQKQCHRQPRWDCSHRKVSGKYEVLLLHGHWPVLGHMFAHSKCSQRYCTNCIVSHPSHNTGQVNIRYIPTHSHAKSLFPETNLKSRLKGYRYVSGNDVVDCSTAIKPFLAQQVCKRLSLTNVRFSIHRWAFRESCLPDVKVGHNAYQKPTKITVETPEHPQKVHWHLLPSIGGSEFGAVCQHIIVSNCVYT